MLIMLFNCIYKCHGLFNDPASLKSGTSKGVY